MVNVTGKQQDIECYLTDRFEKQLLGNSIFKKSFQKDTQKRYQCLLFDENQTTLKEVKK
jgi:hypothetical protein